VRAAGRLHDLRRLRAHRLRTSLPRRCAATSPPTSTPRRGDRRRWPCGLMEKPRLSLRCR
jgi:hypothetical protein